MGLDELQPGNTKRAKATAVKAFGRFLDAEENVSIDAGKCSFCGLSHEDERGARIVDPPLRRLRHVSIARDAMALMTQAAPASDLLDNLPEHSRLKLPFARANNTAAGDPRQRRRLHRAPTPDYRCRDITPTIHSHQLTSHSFRRGSAQHANGSADLTVCWIFDRGAWNMSTTNKGFSYVFNTTKEDHKVSKVLSGWHVDDSISLLDLTRFDTQTQDRIKNVQNRLYTTCKGLGTTRFNVNQRVLDVLTAYLIRHFPLLKEVNPEGPVIKRLETCVMESDCTVADLLSWSTHLVAIPSSCTKEEIKSCKSSKQVLKITEESSIIRHQASVIDHFIQHVKRQDARRTRWKQN
ncbi:hypothetical protein FI667_g16366, partial [Globisporangium splendens]